LAVALHHPLASTDNNTCKRANPEIGRRNLVRLRLVLLLVPSLRQIDLFCQKSMPVRGTSKADRQAWAQRETHSKIILVPVDERATESLMRGLKQ
jgi:hypothetical protein